MQLNRSLCQNYLYENESFWEKAEILAENTQGDPRLAILFESFEKALFVERQPYAAVRIYQRAALYLRTFLHLNTDFFPAVWMGYCLPKAIAHFQSLNVPDEAIRDTFQDLACWAKEFEKLHGRLGVGETGWLLNPYAGRILKLGRLQYELMRYDLPYLLFQNEEGDYRALCLPDLPFDKEGRLLEPEGHEGEAWGRTKLSVNADRVEGFEADFERAVLKNEKVCLTKREWKLILAGGEQVLGLHIRAGEPLTPACVSASLKTAKEFFTKMGYPCQLAFCESWLLDTHLAQFSPDSSNVVRFMKRFRKLPVDGRSSAIETRVFGFDFKHEDLENVAPRTKLQAALKEYRLNGGEVMDMAGFLEL